MVCKKAVSSHLPQLDPIPLIGIIESTNGWVSHSDCLFRLILHPTNNFLEGLASVNKLDKLEKKLSNLIKKTVSQSKDNEE